MSHAPHSPPLVHASHHAGGAPPENVPLSSHHVHALTVDAPSDRSSMIRVAFGRAASPRIRRRGDVADGRNREIARELLELARADRALRTRGTLQHAVLDDDGPDSTRVVGRRPELDGLLQEA